MCVCVGVWWSEAAGGPSQHFTPLDFRRALVTPLTEPNQKHRQLAALLRLSLQAGMVMCERVTVCMDVRQERTGQERCSESTEKGEEKVRLYLLNLSPVR